MVACALALVGQTVVGCASAASTAGATCGEGAVAFTPGLEAATPGGAFIVRLESATPNPPERGPNSIAFTLRRADGEPVTGATVKLSAWMPEHGHGASTMPVAEERGAGRYEVGPLNLFMAGRWELRFELLSEPTPVVATFTLCLES